MVSVETHDEAENIPDGITLEHNKTFYGWKIKMKGEPNKKMIEQLEVLNNEMLQKFGPERKLDLD